MITIASKSDINEIAQIWRVCFTDDSAYLDNYFTFGFPLTDTYVYKIESKIVCSLAIFPVEIGERRGGYLYAVCTLPEFRGQALSSKLLNFAKKESLKKGYQFLVAKPAEESLFKLYEKSNFNLPLFRCHDILSRVEYLNPELTIIQLNKIESNLNENKLHSLRLQLFDNKYLIQWRATELKFIISDCKIREGAAKLINNQLYYLGYPSEENSDTFYLLESNAIERGDLELIASSIFLHYPQINFIDQIKVATDFKENQTTPKCKRRRFASLAILKEESFYDNSSKFFFNFCME